MRTITITSTAITITTTTIEAMSWAPRAWPRGRPAGQILKRFKRFRREEVLGPSRRFDRPVVG